MFATQTYIVVCHGCGTFHENRSKFLSTPMYLGVTDDRNGKEYAIPALGCDDCMAIGKGQSREASPIARAFDHGVTSATLARADVEFNEGGWRDRVVAKR